MGFGRATRFFPFQALFSLTFSNAPFVIKNFESLWYIFSLFRKAHTWLMLKTLHEFHKLPSIFTIKVFYLQKDWWFWWWKIENAQKLNLLFVKKWFVPPVHLRPFQGSCTLLLGQLQQAGWTKILQEIWCQKNDPHSVRMPFPCWIWAIVASWSWGNFQTELVGRFGGWKTNFFGGYLES